MAEQTAAVAETRPLNILIVDDSATMRTMIRRVVDLTELPLGTVYEATNGLEALHILETCMVHAVFTDINMPVMTGYELLTEIARREAWKDILRIVISTDGSRLRQEEVRELNVNLYIRKPFRPEVVRDVLSRIASTHNR
ncbi:MAG: response regulator [Acidobacteria bacterium]|nr:MAG: response regulator [Acidobacteriota bacterium]